MELSLPLVLLYALLPVFCMIIGGFISAKKFPEHVLGLGIQNCAAGVVFAAVTLELLPEVVMAKDVWSMISGFLLGLVLMYLVKEVTERLQRRREVQQDVIIERRIMGVAIDLFVDGLLISIAFLAGIKSGLFVTLALSVEELFLGMTLGRQSERYAKQMFHHILLALVILLGVLSGYGIVHIMPVTAKIFILSFGMSALLYLVTEELLTQVHSKVETPWMTAMFLIGFLFILIFESFW